MYRWLDRIHKNNDIGHFNFMSSGPTYDRWKAIVERGNVSRDSLLASGVEQLKQKEKKNIVHRVEERNNNVLGQCVVEDTCVCSMWLYLCMAERVHVYERNSVRDSVHAGIAV